LVRLCRRRVPVLTQIPSDLRWGSGRFTLRELPQQPLRQGHAAHKGLSLLRPQPRHKPAAGNTSVQRCKSEPQVRVWDLEGNIK